MESDLSHQEQDYLAQFAATPWEMRKQQPVESTLQDLRHAICNTIDWLITSESEGDRVQGRILAAAWLQTDYLGGTLEEMRDLQESRDLLSNVDG